MKYQGIFHFNFKAKKGWELKVGGASPNHQNRLGFVEKVLP
jgi:hypothetical protein